MCENLKKNLSTHDPIIVTVECNLQKIDINSQRQENIRVKWDKIDKEQYKILLEENMKDVAQIVQTEDDKPQNIDNIITEFPVVYVTFLLPFPVVKFSLFHD
jgi:hypothetical protein